MPVYDILPDIHGQIDILEKALFTLGYRNPNGPWRHPDPDRSALFLGDLIDRGPGQIRVLETVRGMIDEGSARAIMGNHEFNALAYHTRHPETGEPLRLRNGPNTAQHQAFLDELPVGSPVTGYWLDWMSRLPVAVELPDLRIVHACWDAGSVSIVNDVLDREGGFTTEALVAFREKGSAPRAAVETLLKGPEFRLPNGVSFRDKDGRKRKNSRIAWWKHDIRNWAEAVASWPDDKPLPPGGLDPASLETVRRVSYPDTARPVFFGHYWLSGDIRAQSSNAFCLDYSAGKGGTLVSYRFETGGDQEFRDGSAITVQNP